MDVNNPSEVFYDVPDDEHFRDIKLQPHQKKIIKFLVAKCRKQKGLLVNHYQGTGKTITGIFFLKNYPKYVKLILAPQALKSMWVTACKDNGIDTDNAANKKQFQFISYEYLDALSYYQNDEFEKAMSKLTIIFQNSILISDEAHNLIQIFEFCQEQGQDHLEDLTKAVTPGEKLRFIATNDNIMLYRSKLKKYLELFTSCSKILFLTGTPVVNYCADIRWFINLSAGHMVVPYIDFSTAYGNQTKVFERLQKVLKPVIKLFGNESYMPSWMLYGAGVQQYKANIMAILDLFITPFLTGYSIADKFVKKIICNGIMYSLNLVSKQFSTFKLDVSKVERAGWGKYVSFYKYDNLDYYPSMIVKNMPTTYTNYQYDVWLRGNDDKLTYEEYVVLDFIGNLNDAKLFKSYSSIGINEKQGRIIGNMGETEEPKKFVEIAQDYQDNNVSTLIYSNYFESGILLLSKFLTTRKIEHTIFDTSLTTEQKEKILNDFEEQTIKLVLLHPAFFEGFSIKGVRRFHILEPVNSYYMKEQLYTRVVRLNSHQHLPIEERNVTICQWYISFDQIIEQITVQSKKMFKNLEFDLTEIIYEKSPDQMCMKEAESGEGWRTNMAEVLRKVAMDSNEVLQNLNEECCIYGDICDSPLPDCDDLPKSDLPKSNEFFSDSSENNSASLDSPSQSEPDDLLAENSLTDENLTENQAADDDTPSPSDFFSSFSP